MIFGVAKDLITPDFKTHMAGYGSYFDQYFTGIHDDLYVRALLLDDGQQKILMLSLDLLFHDRQLTELVKAYAYEKFGFAHEHVFISYSHTHGGPAVRGYDDSSMHSEEYEHFLQGRIFNCINRTMINQFEGTFHYGSVEGDWNINRRRPVEGRIENRPNPDGPKDDNLHLLQVKDLDGNVKVLLFNFACHPVTVRDALVLSGDFPSRICHLLEAECFGSTAIFFQGAGGNSRPKITAKGSQFEACTFEEMNEMSVAMVQSMKQLLFKGKLKQLRPSLAAAQFDVSLQIDPFLKSDIEQLVADDHVFPGIRRVAGKLLEQYDQMADEVQLAAGLIRLSEDTYIAFMGGEPCFEVKEKLAAALNVPHLLFIGYMDSTAYIPDDKIIAEGGYEASESALEYGLKGGFKQGIDTRLATKFLTCLAEMK